MSHLEVNMARNEVRTETRVAGDETVLGTVPLGDEREKFSQNSGREESEDYFSWADDVEPDYPPSWEHSASDDMAGQIEALKRRVTELERENNRLKDQLITTRRDNVRRNMIICNPATGVDTTRGANRGRTGSNSAYGGISKQTAPTALRVCYSCKKTGHIARDCALRKRNPPEPRSSRVIKPVRITCRFCFNPGHIGKNCKIQKKRQEKAVGKLQQQGGNTKTSE